MQVGPTNIIIKCGDITKEVADVIVNAANSGLAGGGGVDGAIHRAGGPTILEECRQIVRTQGNCPPGEAVITGGGNLTARHVVHTVGPIWRGGTAHEADILRRAYRNSLALAARSGASTIAFPSISTGAYRYPIEQAAQVALSAVISFAKENACFTEIRLVLFSEKDLQVYQRTLDTLAHSA